MHVYSTEKVCKYGETYYYSYYHYYIIADYDQLLYQINWKRLTRITSVHNLTVMRINLTFNEFNDDEYCRSSLLNEWLQLIKCGCVKYRCTGMHTNTPAYSLHCALQHPAASTITTNKFTRVTEWNANKLNFAKVRIMHRCSAWMRQVNSPAVVLFRDLMPAGSYGMLSTIKMFNS